ncbi:hypothetical protein [Stappia stellulata]|uniref:hypothetical protein n=1 Tax=Stappia stellulata TaxID=71235 RepID=UPI00042547DF|nr:hypothetical protein [Stappia stellulata]
MKAFVAAVIAVAVIGVGSWAVLTRGLDYSAASVYTTSTPGAVRLSSGERN